MLSIYHDCRFLQSCFFGMILGSGLILRWLSPEDIPCYGERNVGKHEHPFPTNNRSSGIYCFKNLFALFPYNSWPSSSSISKWYPLHNPFSYLTMLFSFYMSVPPYWLYYSGDCFVHISILPSNIIVVNLQPSNTFELSVQVPALVFVLGRHNIRIAADLCVCSTVSIKWNVAYLNIATLQVINMFTAGKRNRNR